MFDDIALHPRTRALALKIADNLPHGLIIDGASGSGVVTVARAFARAVGSPEIVLYPKKKQKSEFIIDMNDGNIIIDDIRELYEQTRTKQPGQRVYVIDTGNKSLTVPAQNAFLKLLEEPRDGVHFIIATHRPDQLLPTIISRSQRLSLLPITIEQTQQLINELQVSDETKRARLTFVGQGRPALIHRLANDDNLYEKRVGIMTDAKTMISGETYDKLVVIHRYRDNRVDTITLLDDMNHQLQTIIRRQPDQRLVRDIERHLRTRDLIARAGNIRLQLTADVL